MTLYAAFILAYMVLWSESMDRREILKPNYFLHLSYCLPKPSYQT